MEYPAYKEPHITVLLPGHRHHVTCMGHMQDPGKGSALLQCISTWLKLMSNYMKEQIYKLAKKGHKLVWSWGTYDVAQILKSKRLAFVLLKVICPLIKKGVVLGGGGGTRL